LRVTAAWAIISAMNSAMRKRTLPALALLLAVALAAPAQADRKRWGAEASPQGFAPRSMAERRISLEQAIAIVQRETGGRVLDARDQGERYRVKILTRRGEVQVVYVDAATGEMR
jgi:uncharacterized membrane protein YkoI